ncbi:MAG: DUF4129 domain-containing protein [Flavobacteriales bacterium]
MFQLICFTQIQFAFSQNAEQPVWTDEQWEQAKGGMGYEDFPKEKTEEKKEKPPQDPIDPGDFETQEDIESSWSLGTIFSSSMAKFIGIMLLLVILIVVVYFFMQGTKSNKDSKVQLAFDAMPDVLEDLPEETDLERFLRMSLEAGDYKTAIRILYIMIIQRMHERNWIIWKKDKTNRDYLNEVRSRKSYGQFRDITLVYEIVWYGDNEISGTEFHALKSLFDTYKGSVNDGTDA